MKTNMINQSIFKFRKSLFLSVFFLFSIISYSQTDSLAIEKLRTESGVDPTRINSRVGYSNLYSTKKNNASQISNKFSLILGVNNWSFSIKPEILTQHNGVAGDGFKTAFSDVKFSVLNAFYIKNKSSLAGSVEFNIPFGREQFGSQFFSATPAITYSYTINSGLFVSIQPQYTFAIAKDNFYPDLSIMTNRIFIAKFTKNGIFYVFEPRTIIDFERNTFDLIISPIIGKSLGAGFNIIGLIEFPTKQSTRDFRGVLYQLGLNKNF